MDTAPTETIEMAKGKAITEQIIIRVRRVQLSMAFFKKFQYPQYAQYGQMRVQQRPNMKTKGVKIWILKK